MAKSTYTGRNIHNLEAGMTMSISGLLLIIAFILFALSAFGLPVGRFSLVSAGLACWLLSEILGAGILR